MLPWQKRVLGELGEFNWLRSCLRRVLRGLRRVAPVRTRPVGHRPSLLEAARSLGKVRPRSGQGVRRRDWLRTQHGGSGSVIVDVLEVPSSVLDAGCAGNMAIWHQQQYLRKDWMVGGLLLLGECRRGSGRDCSFSNGTIL